MLKWDGNRDTFAEHVKKVPNWDTRMDGLACMADTIWPREEDWSRHLDMLIGEFESEEMVVEFHPD